MVYILFQSSSSVSLLSVPFSACLFTHTVSTTFVLSYIITLELASFTAHQTFSIHTLAQLHLTDPQYRLLQRRAHHTNSRHNDIYKVTRVPPYAAPPREIPFSTWLHQDLWHLLTSPTTTKCRMLHTTFTATTWRPEATSTAQHPIPRSLEPGSSLGTSERVVKLSTISTYM